CLASTSPSRKRAARSSRSRTGRRCITWQSWAVMPLARRWSTASSIRGGCSCSTLSSLACWRFVPTAVKRNGRSNEAVAGCAGTSARFGERTGHCLPRVLRAVLVDLGAPAPHSMVGNVAADAVHSHQDHHHRDRARDDRRLHLHDLPPQLPPAILDRDIHHS